MPTYFKPLRRKIGVITLVLACVLTAGWIRSNGKVESLRFNIARFQPIVISGDQHLWFTFQRRRIVLSFATLMFPNQSVRLDNNFITSVDNIADCKRMIELTPIGMGTFFDEPLILSDSRMFIDKSIAKNRLTGIPYWSIVIPLTLFSAWLLFSRPRAKRLPENPV